MRDIGLKELASRLIQLFIHFQADADLRQAIVTGTIRRQPKLNFQSANEARLEGIKDLGVLAIAARDNRVLVTYDRKTMPIEFGQ